MYAHVNIVQGDYIFKQWVHEDMKNIWSKCKELETKGYEMVKEEHDYLNAYFHFSKKGCKEIIVTLMLY